MAAILTGHPFGATSYLTLSDIQTMGC